MQGMGPPGPPGAFRGRGNFQAFMRGGFENGRGGFFRGRGRDGFGVRPQAVQIFSEGKQGLHHADSLAQVLWSDAQPACEQVAASVSLDSPLHVVPQATQPALPCRAERLFRTTSGAEADAFVAGTRDPAATTLGSGVVSCLRATRLCMEVRFSVDENAVGRTHVVPSCKPAVGDQG